MYRILFAPHHSGELPLQAAGAPISISSRRPSFPPDIAHFIKEEYSRTTRNPGNLIHCEAPSDILECSDTGSARVNLPHFISGHVKRQGIENAMKLLEARFDLAVISMANDLRASVGGDYYWFLSRLLDSTNIPVHIFGLGLENSGLKHESLSKELVGFLQACERHAVTFGARCQYTESWLHQHGYSRAFALGCPSMYRSPIGIANAIKARPTAKSSILSAGYINNKPRHLKLEAIIDVARPRKAAYIFQSDLLPFVRGSGSVEMAGSYNYWTGEVDYSIVNTIYSQLYGRASPFTEFRAFSDPRHWISFSANFDLFIGDRLHGCIAALTAGTPSLLLYADSRVKGLSEFFGIPSINLASKALVKDSEEQLTHLMGGTLAEAFLRQYISRLQNFVRHLNQVGLGLNRRVSREYSLVIAQ